jgi:ABC-type dipeptide/oligopeptide/nickel transport system permease subunit
VAPYLVLATTHLGVAIVIEAALGFLGVGVPPPTPTWGNMLADAITGLIPQWWLVLFPGMAITVTVLAFNLLGDGIRDSLDPKLAPAALRLVTGVRGSARRAPAPAATPAPSAQGQPGAA